MANLIIGDGQSRNAQADADLFASVFGDDLVILNSDNQMSAAIKDNNTVRVQSGIALIEGRPLQIENGTYEDFTIPTGTQGTETTYYLGWKISADSTGKQSATQMVSTEKTDTGSIRSGDSAMYAWVYSAYVNGVVLTSITRLCGIVGVASGNIPGITYGTSAANDSDGMPDGSIYIQYS